MTSRAEQETSITMTNDEPLARIYSCDPVFKTKMARAGHVAYKVWEDAMFYQIPKSCISIRSVPKPNPELAERRAAIMRQNLHKPDANQGSDAPDKRGEDEPLSSPSSANPSKPMEASTPVHAPGAAQGVPLRPRSRKTGREPPLPASQQHLFDMDPEDAQYTRW